MVNLICRIPEKNCVGHPGGVYVDLLLTSTILMALITIMLKLILMKMSAENKHE